METAVVPPTTFEGRAESIRPRLEPQRNNRGELASVWHPARVLEYFVTYQKVMTV